MISVLVALSLAQTPSPQGLDRYALGERLKMLDLHWVQTQDRARKSAAIAPLSSAVMAFFANRGGEAARNLDLALTNLQGVPHTAEHGISLRFIPSFCEPGKEANLRVSWAYFKPEDQPVTVTVAGRRVVVAPGREVNLSVNPQRADAEFVTNSESTTAIPVMVGRLQRYVNLSIVKSARSRTATLLNSKDPTAKTIARLVSESIEDPEKLEQDVPLSHLIDLAEKLNTKKLALWQIADFERVEHKGSVFRCSFPAESRVSPEKANPVNVVFAFHGAGGSENLFFEGYGRGLAVNEAMKRGWVFVAPRVGTSALSNALDWLQVVRKLKIGKIFLMGHSMGGGYAYSAHSTISTAAMALFAPAANLRKDQVKSPLYLSVGKQEIGMLSSTILRVAKEMEGTSQFHFDLIDPCEHLMIVAESIRPAYSFFDQILKSQPPTVDQVKLNSSSDLR